MVLAKTPRLMQSSEIPAFVDEVINAVLSDICAVGQDSYVIGDADIDIDIEEVDEVVEELQCIDEVYGDRDFLKLEIVAHLRSLGRYLDAPEVTHWSGNPKQN